MADAAAWTEEVAEGKGARMIECARVCARLGHTDKAMVLLTLKAGLDARAINAQATPLDATASQQVLEAAGVADDADLRAALLGTMPAESTSSVAAGTSADVMLSVAGPATATDALVEEAPAAEAPDEQVRKGTLWCADGWLESVPLWEPLLVSLAIPEGADEYAHVKGLTEEQLRNRLQAAGLEGHLEDMWLELEHLRGQAAATGV